MRPLKRRLPDLNVFCAHKLFHSSSVRAKMEGKSGSKLQHLDLGHRRSDLEEIFDSTINKIPDLFLPPAYRWAGEEDFFNETKSLKLTPFRKQQNFETSISPDLSLRHSGRGSTQDGVSKSASKIRVLKSPSPQPEARHAKVSFGAASNGAEKVSSRKSRTAVDSEESYIEGIDGRRGEQSNVRKKYEAREKLIRKYSRLRVKKTVNPEEENQREGYDRLFRKSFAADYPLPNPIAECMLTGDNIDNLRELIVSSINIEWRMLTPIKPASDYEEKYFDKLIYLHRNRYRCRLESGYFRAKAQLPFKHTRHSFMLDYTLPKIARNSASNSSSVRERSERNTKHPVKLTIPELTLTSDDQSSELPVKLGGGSEVAAAAQHDDETDDDDEEDGSNADGDLSDGADDEHDDGDSRDFSYERFSRNNADQSPRLIKRKSEQQSLSCFVDDDEPSTSQDELGSIRDEEELEDQVEMIINQLVNIDLSP